MLGCAEVEVGIAAGVYKTPVVVSARKERPNFIIGADFLSTHDCDLSLRQKLFIVGQDSVWCLPEINKRVRASHARLKLARQVESTLSLHTRSVVRQPRALNTLARLVLWHNQLAIAGVMPRMGWS